MLTQLYIEALLADEALADEVWALWDAGVITDAVAAWAWRLKAKLTVPRMPGKPARGRCSGGWRRHLSKSNVDVPADARYWNG